MASVVPCSAVDYVKIKMYQRCCFHFQLKAKNRTLYIKQVLLIKSTYIMYVDAYGHGHKE